MLVIFMATEWWFMYGNQSHTLSNLALKVLSQTTSSSACERNWNTFCFDPYKTKKLASLPSTPTISFFLLQHETKIRDMQAEIDKVVEKDYLDLLVISTEFGEEENNQLFQWVRPLHLDDKNGNLDPRIAAHVQEAGVDVERVLSEDVHSESFS